jgi:hypothetical protein
MSGHIGAMRSETMNLGIHYHRETAGLVPVEEFDTGLFTETKEV